MAEVYYMHVLPHCAIGPVAFSASLHVDAVTPNFLMQEQIDNGLGAGLLQTPWQVKDGFIDLPTKPGLGIESSRAQCSASTEYQRRAGRRVLSSGRRQHRRLVGAPERSRSHRSARGTHCPITVVHIQGVDGKCDRLVWNVRENPATFVVRLRRAAHDRQATHATGSLPSSRTCIVLCSPLASVTRSAE